VKIIKLLHWIRDNRINVDGRDVEIDIAPYMDELELLSEKNAKLVQDKRIMAEAILQAPLFKNHPAWQLSVAALKEVGRD